MHKRRRIVYAVADHSHKSRLFLEPADFSHLLVWKHLCQHFGYADFPRDSLSSSPVVTRQHGSLQSQLLQLRNSLHRIVLESIGLCNYPYALAVLSDEHNGFRFFLQTLKLMLQAAVVDFCCVQEFPVADQHCALPFDFRFYSSTRY